MLTTSAGKGIIRLRTHHMPPLMGVRAHAGRAAGVSTTGRTRATRARTGRAPLAGQVTSWPKLLTELTCWRHTGDPYQVPIKPAAIGHALVGVRGPTQAFTEYTRMALELIAFLMGMAAERVAAQPLWYSGSSHTESTSDGNCTCTITTSYSSREERETGPNTQLRRASWSRAEEPFGASVE